MARLALDIQNYLRQQPEITALVGKSKTWPSWIWADRPAGKIEGYGAIAPERSSLVVITEDNGWASPNEHNTARFPRVYVDVWSDPSRMENGDVRTYDADIKIGDLHKVIAKYLHLVDLGTSMGQPVCWGTADQMANYTGSIIAGSSRTQEPVYADVRDGNGARMGTATYGVILL